MFVMKYNFIGLKRQKNRHTEGAHRDPYIKLLSESSKAKSTD
jgi:hypothetical protein